MKVILIDPPVFLLLQEKERVLRQETIDTSAQDRLMIPKEELDELKRFQTTCSSISSSPFPKGKLK